MTWVRSTRGKRLVHWQRKGGVLLCAELLPIVPGKVEPAELSPAGHPYGVICSFCLKARAPAHA